MATITENVNSRIEQVLELLGLTPSNWRVSWCQPIDDLDQTRRVAWDFTLGCHYGGGSVCYHKNDPIVQRLQEDFQADSWPVLCEIISQAFVLDLLIAGLPNRDFITTARRMYQHRSGKGFLRSYLEYWLGQKQFLLQCKLMSPKMRWKLQRIQWAS